MFRAKEPKGACGPLMETSQLPDRQVELKNHAACFHRCSVCPRDRRLFAPADDGGGVCTDDASHSDEPAQLGPDEPQCSNHRCWCSAEPAGQLPDELRGRDCINVLPVTAWGDPVWGTIALSISIQIVGLACLMIALAVGAIAKKITGRENPITRWMAR